MTKIHEPTGLPILTRPSPPPGVTPAKLEAWVDPNGALQLLLSLNGNEENSLPSLIMEAAHGLVSERIQAVLGPPKEVFGVAEDSL